MNILLKNNWWKSIAVVLILYSIVAGLMLPVPRLPVLNESIRNLYFHVPMWFGMVVMLIFSFTFSIKYLSGSNLKHDLYAKNFAFTAMIFGILGLITGMFWAAATWGAWWVNDPKLNGAVVGLLVYLAYFVLRGSLEDEHTKAKVAAVYSIFAFVLYIAFIYVIPRMTDSLHPGSGGNPGFNVYDLDSRMRVVFYPAVIGWIVLGVWISTLLIRLNLLEEKDED
ncbi:MAG: ABC transporter permease [Chitinophagaceae bacterium]|nr:MAG: ABC transporter permease [Chitinophagaceae bacterium]